jgi:glycyl-tRNA synthetase
MTKSMDDIMALCKRRGFVFQASEIYGGINGFWDYGPLGAQLKKNLRDAWWHDVVMTGCNGRMGPDGNPVRIVPIDSCIIQNPKVWEASGHVGGFNDPMVDDQETKRRFRADQLFGMYLMWSSKQSPAEMLDELEGYALDSEQELPHGPNLTCVASGPEEALGMFRSVEKKIRAKINVHDGGYRYPIFDYISNRGDQDKPVFGAVLPVPSWILKDHPNHIPSPFNDPSAEALKEFPPNGPVSKLMAPRPFNLMFRTFLGATATEDDIAYLRPETAQGIFINFKNVVDSTRVGVPFGIAQTGKSFRNEVTPRNFTFRSREFEQMEVEFFCHDDDAQAWYEFWRDWRMQWWQDLGLAGENLILREHEKDELSHYSTATSDVEYRFPFTAPGFGELEGVAHRGCYDLTQHKEHSGAKLEYFDPKRGELAKNGQPKGERYLPTVIEPSAGLDRGVLAALCEAYTKDESRPSPEIMKFHPRLAPIKAAVFPLVNKDGMPEVANKLFAEIRNRVGSSGFVETDAKQSIGKRYARMDEGGCPFCFTVDGDTLSDQTVTVRDRDTGSQERIGLDRAPDFLGEKLGL